MANFKNIRTVSSIAGQTPEAFGTIPSVPTLRIEGKWLEDFTRIGDKYKLNKNPNKREIIIKFL